MARHVSVAAVAPLLVALIVIGGALDPSPAAAAAHPKAPITGPAVVTFSVTSPNPTLLPNVAYALTFSETVTGLTAADFSTSGNATGCAIDPPSFANGASAITVAGCSEGTVVLTLAAGSVTDSHGNVGPSAPATAATVTIDQTAPAVLSLTPAETLVTTSSVAYSLTFSEPVDGLAAADFGVSGSSSGWTVASVTGADASYTVNLSASTVVTGTLDLTLHVNAVADRAGNPGPATAFSAPSVSVQAPSALSLSIDGGSASSGDPTLHLSLLATDFDSGATMEFSLDKGATWTAPEPIATTKDLPLPPKWPWGVLRVDARVAEAGADTKETSASISYVMAPRSTMALQSSYVLTTTLDYTHARLTTRMSVKIFDANELPIGYLDFSVLAHAFGELSVTSASIDGRAATPTYPNSADLRLPLGFNLRQTEGLTVEIAFVATATSDISNSLKARFSKANGLMQISSWYPVLSNGHGLRYPGDSQYTVASAVRVELTHPASVLIAAPGTLVSSTATTKVYTMPATREFAFGASPSFLHRSALASGVSVVVYALSGAAASTALTAATSALAKYVNSYGSYPGSRFVIAQSTRPSSGNEYSGIVFIGSSGLTLAHTVAHETAHQWFYHQVGNDQLGAPWLDEAFAEFAARRALGIAMPSYCSTLKVDVSVYVFPNAPATNDCNQYNQTIYNKGAAFLGGIRSRMGALAFGTAMRAIVSQNRFGIVTTAIVRATFLHYAGNPTSLSTYMSGFIH